MSGVQTSDESSPSYEIVLSIDIVAAEVQANQPLSTIPLYRPDEPLNEAEMVMVALAFNPDLRGRRIAATQLGATSIGAIVNFTPGADAKLKTIQELEAKLSSGGVSIGKRAPGIRLSVHAHNTPEDIERVLALL